MYVSEDLLITKHTLMYLIVFTSQEEEMPIEGALLHESFTFSISILFLVITLVNIISYN